MISISAELRTIIWIITGIATVSFAIFSIVLETNLSYLVRKVFPQLRREGGRPPTKKPFILWMLFTISAAVLIIGTALASALPESHSPTREPSFISTPELNKGLPEIENVLIGENADKYQILVTVKNPKGNEILVKEIKIWHQSKEAGMACDPRWLYELSTDVFLNEVDGSQIRFEGSYATDSSNQSNYFYPAQGAYNPMDGCGNFFVFVGFDTSMIFTKESYSQFAISIPKEMKVIGSRPELPPEELPPNQEITLHLSKPDYPDSYSEYDVYIEISYDDNQLMSYTIDLLK